MAKERDKKKAEQWLKKGTKKAERQQKKGAKKAVEKKDLLN